MSYRLFVYRKFSKSEIGKDLSHFDVVNYDDYDQAAEGFKTFAGSGDVVSCQLTNLDGGEVLMWWDLLFQNSLTTKILSTDPLLNAMLKSFMVREFVAP